MAKKIKFPLKLKNDVQARSLKDIQDNFDIEKIVQYYLDGKLIAWLENHYYENEANAVEMLNKSDRYLEKKLCQIFGVEYVESENLIELTEMEERNRKLSILKQFTSDPAILDNIDHVAFDQEDLTDLLDDCVYQIYLCNNSFTIPLQVRSKYYIGLGSAKVSFASKEILQSSLDTGVRFSNVHFDLDINHWLHTTPEGLYRLYLFTSNYEERELYLRQAVEMGNTDAMVDYANHPDDSRHKWMQKAAELGNGMAMYFISEIKHQEGETDSARRWLEKAAASGSPDAIWRFFNSYYEGVYGYPRDANKALMFSGILAHIDKYFDAESTFIDTFIHNEAEKFSYVRKFSKKGYPYSMRAEARYILGIIGNGSQKNMSRSEYAIELLEKNARLNADSESMRQLGECYAKGIGVEENINKAVKWYERAIHYNSSYSLDLGKMYEDKGMNNDALRTYRRFLDKAEEWQKDDIAKATERINALK